MKTLGLILLLALLTACSPPASQTYPSPGGVYLLSPEVSGDEAGPTRRLCVRLRILNKKTQKESVFQTGASNNSTWAVGWHGEVPVLFSTDIGTYAYDLVGNAISERPANDQEAEVGRRAYEQKYGKRP